MVNFSHLEKLAVDNESTAPYPFPRIMGVPVLTVRPAHRINRDFLNVMLAASKDVSRQAQKALNGEDMQLDKVREQDVEIFADCIVVDWENVQDADGNEVPFSKEACVEFLSKIPEDMFDNLRIFCLNIENFRGGRKPVTKQEEEAISGN